jgi:hypothetical protein
VKILKKKYGYREGREASGERRTVWKGVRLVVDLENEKDNDHTDHSLLHPPKTICVQLKSSSLYSFFHILLLFFFINYKINSDEGTLMIRLGNRLCLNH